MASTASASMDFYEGAVSGFYVCRDPFGCIVILQPSAPTPLVNATPAPKILFYEGAVENFLVCRDPYTCQPTNLQAEGVVCSLGLAIENPEANHRYYENTPLTNLTLQGVSSCGYRISYGGVDYLWNSWSDCAVKPNKSITYPDGEITLTVNGSNGVCTTQNTSTFNVTTHHQRRARLQGIGTVWIAAAGLITLVFLAEISRKRRRHS